MDYHKKILSPIILYSKFHQLYFSYFEGTYIKKIDYVPITDEQYLLNFYSNNSDKIGSTIDDFSKYILWIFSEYGKINLHSLHTYINQYIKVKDDKIKPFASKVVAWLKKNKISRWEEYVEPTKREYPKILYHYISTKEIPFEFILYLGILDKLKGIMKSQVKAVLGKELYSVKKQLVIMERNKDFYVNEIKEIFERMTWI